MSFMDKLKQYTNSAANSVGKAATSVSESSKKLAEKTKLKHNISAEESAIKGNYLTIGKKFYESGGKASVDEFKELFNDIDTGKKEIESLKARIEALDGVVKCPKCGVDIPVNEKFCSNCGTQNPKYVETPEEKDENKTDSDVIDVEAKEVESKPTESDADVYTGDDSDSEAEDKN